MEVARTRLARYDGEAGGWSQAYLTECIIFFGFGKSPPPQNRQLIIYLIKI